MPFGDVEDPVGFVTPARRKEDLDVFAFREVFERASTLALSDVLQIRIPTTAGYCALKMSAWANRSPIGEMRDGPDLAAAVYWYLEFPAIMDRLYDTAEGDKVLQAAEYDLLLATARLLGQDIHDELGVERGEQLLTRWPDDVRTRLVREFGDDTLPAWPTDRGRRSAIIEALCAGLWST